jgi:threonine dehydratase
MKPDITIIGAQARVCPSASEALRKGSPCRAEAGKTIADGIRVAETGVYTFPIIQRYVDRHVLATEEEIADAMLMLLERKHVIAEGAGAVPLASLMNGSIDVSSGISIVLVISGGNVDSALLFRIIRQSLARQGRIMRFSVLLDDQPGTLAGILTSIAQKGGNILHIHHLQGESDVPVLMARVTFELETRGWDHISGIKKVLADAGYEIRME